MLTDEARWQVCGDWFHYYFIVCMKISIVNGNKQFYLLNQPGGQYTHFDVGVVSVAGGMVSHLHCTHGRISVTSGKNGVGVGWK